MTDNINPSIRAALERHKLESSAELGINLKTGNKIRATSFESGSTGSQSAKKIIIAHENGLQ